MAIAFAGVNAGLGQGTFSPFVSAMSTVEEIENIIQQLPERDVLTLTQSLDDYAGRKMGRAL